MNQANFGPNMQRYFKLSIQSLTKPHKEKYCAEKHKYIVSRAL